MKPFDDNGKELDAIFSVSHAGKDRIHLTLESRGGGVGGPRPPRNADYAGGIELLFSRLGKLNAVIENVEVFSRIAEKLPSEDRRISAPSVPLPCRIQDISDLRQFRLELGQAAKKVGQTKNTGGGNATKKLRFLLKWDAAQSKSENDLELILANSLLSSSAKAETSLSKYEKLGEHLRSSTNSEIRIQLSEIEAIIGTTLPQEARKAQFWANTVKFHPTRRDQWLGADYKAFYEKRTETVRFTKTTATHSTKFEKFLEPTDNPNELQRRVALAKNKMFNPDGSLIDPPQGSNEVKTAQSNITRHVRDPKVIAWVLAKAAGNCEECLSTAPFIDKEGAQFLEVHHVRPLAEGGPDKTDNAVALCPNCHRFFHYGKDVSTARNNLISKIERLIDYPLRTP